MGVLAMLALVEDETPTTRNELRTSVSLEDAELTRALRALLESSLVRFVEQRRPPFRKQGLIITDAGREWLTIERAVDRGRPQSQARLRPNPAFTQAA